MKTTDLRVGNDIILNGVVCKVESVGDCWINCTLFEGGYGAHGSMEYDFYQDEYPIRNVGTWEPIPLTDEWLLLFGYEYNNLTGLYHDKLHCITFSDQEDISRKFMPFCTNDKDCYIEIKYVHQLQNINFALTGQDL